MNDADTPLERISKEEMYMRMALILSARSTCRRKDINGTIKRVGCVITTSNLNNVLSVGYNGNASGLDDRCDNPDQPGNCGCLHAEENAIAKCHAPDRDKIMFSTDAPCKRCAKFIIQNGFRKVYYLRKYRSCEGLELLAKVSIETEQLALTQNDILNQICSASNGWN
ncbi:MAG: hypothetical protein AB1454_03030 [Candidatus Auribacterota bacterium]|jgi:dCMP deaminase|uniref:CMP/dCMP-type deaminase domain-containing protein n=1 Tax=Candidatus Auribacter fodinae TaxID=2093366 RepID=A0A3A4R1H7_9BACT|nr:MAG: hypothetical protein C4541_08245 [Candidatus Auribacter fodinae]